MEALCVSVPLWFVAPIPAAAIAPIATAERTTIQVFTAPYCGVLRSRGSAPSSRPACGTVRNGNMDKYSLSF